MKFQYKINRIKKYNFNIQLFAPVYYIHYTTNYCLGLKNVAEIEYFNM